MESNTKLLNYYKNALHQYLKSKPSFHNCGDTSQLQMYSLVFNAVQTINSYVPVELLPLDDIKFNSTTNPVTDEQLCTTEKELVLLAEYSLQTYKIILGHYSKALYTFILTEEDAKLSKQMTTIYTNVKDKFEKRTENYLNDLRKPIHNTISLGDILLAPENFVPNIFKTYFLGDTFNMDILNVDEVSFSEIQEVKPLIQGLLESTKDFLFTKELSLNKRYRNFEKKHQISLLSNISESDSIALLEHEEILSLEHSNTYQFRDNCDNFFILSEITKNNIATNIKELDITLPNREEAELEMTETENLDEFKKAIATKSIQEIYDESSLLDEEIKELRQIVNNEEATILKIKKRLTKKKSKEDEELLLFHTQQLVKLQNRLNSRLLRRKAIESSDISYSSEYIKLCEKKERENDKHNNLVNKDSVAYRLSSITNVPFIEIEILVDRLHAKGFFENKFITKMYGDIDKTEINSINKIVAEEVKDSFFSENIINQERDDFIYLLHQDKIDKILSDDFELY